MSNVTEELTIEEVIEFFIDKEGTEIENPEKNGKGVVINGETYRKGESVKVVILSGELYEGVISKVSTLKAGSNKDMVIADENNAVSYAIPYSVFKAIDRI